jgi:ATP phosphoribosyltransferase regulatory subunit
MNISDSLLRKDEKAILALRSLYSQYGYVQFKMNKFEEYDLYAKNKDYLVSDNVLTFTDTNGKLMALKPDVTLSIIKNCKDRQDSLEKVYYNENVYRISKSTHSFQEIMQVGLECIGNLDDYAIYEVLTLAAESLAQISPDYILDISQLDIVQRVLDSLDVETEVRQLLLKCIGEKNTSGIRELCRKAGAAEAPMELLCRLVGAGGAPGGTIRMLRNEPLSGNFRRELDQLERIAALLEDSPLCGHIHLDFSVINDMNYYNGIVFSGFVNGIPNSILSGGQYGRLMRRMGHRTEAIGFAVYLDFLDYLRGPSGTENDADTVLLYEDGTDLKKLRDAVRRRTDAGQRVAVLRSVPEGFRYQKICRIGKDGVETNG